MQKDGPYLLGKKQAGIPIAMVTCYDHPTAEMADAAGMDIVFVGDSVGTNVLGYAAEADVTMADMLHHLRAVRRGVREAYLLVDLPYRSYDTPELALANAQQFLAEGADAVKLEGGTAEQVKVVEALVGQGIAVCGHIGFTPQTLGRKGRVQAKSVSEAKQLISSALALEQAGLSLLVLELVSSPVSRLLTRLLRIPTIGIGSGPECDGQVQVITDLLGISTLQLRHALRYEQLRERITTALSTYVREVQEHVVPTDAQAFDRTSFEDMAELEAWVRDTLPLVTRGESSGGPRRS